MLISQYIHIFIWGIEFVENFADSQALPLQMKVNLLKLISIYFSKADNIKTNCTGEQLDVFEHFTMLVKSKVLRQGALALLRAALPTHGTLVTALEVLLAGVNQHPPFCKTVYLSESSFQMYKQSVQENPPSATPWRKEQSPKPSPSDQEGTKTKVGATPPQRRSLRHGCT